MREATKPGGDNGLSKRFAEMTYPLDLRMTCRPADELAAQLPMGSLDAIGRPAPRDVVGFRRYGAALSTLARLGIDYGRVYFRSRAG